MERSNSSTSSPAEAVKVVIRCRPMNEKEVAENYQRVVNVFPTRGTVEITNPLKPDSKREFTFDTVYDWNSSQKELFEESVKPLVDSVLQGYNGTIFAYGQTGTGKTYTMEGIAKDAEQQGLIPRSFSHIFNHISQSCDRQFLVRASYMEIYQEQIKDLLAKDQKKTLEMREHPDKGVYIKDLSSFVCKSVGEIEHVMNVGNQNRSIGATNMNEHSSRSHAIFMITIESCAVCPGQTDGKSSSIVVGKLNMVDLAGSERQAKTGAVGDRLKEATKINLSLSALGNVISALVDSKTSHVPYRDSKLTRLLQDSLGGNSRTVMVANVGPASYNYEESLTTLRYANRAKHIRNKPQINEDPKDALIRSFQEEIARLKAHLEMKKMRNKKKNGGPQSPDDESGAEWSAKEAALEQEKKDILNNRSLIAEEKERLLQVLTTKQAELNKKREDQEKLATRVAALESKLLTGTATMAAVSPNTSFEDVTKQQKLTLEKRRQEIIERERREREMRQQLEAQDEEVLDFKENFTSLQQEIEYKTRKLRKMYAKWQSVKQEMSDLSAEFRQQRQELEQAQEVLLKELRLKQVLINHFIPTDFKQQMMARATYDEEEEKWVLKPSTQAPMLPLICSSRMDLRPTSEYEKHSRLSEDQSTQMGQYRFENILLLGLDIPPRSTKDYVAPEVSPTLQAALTEALHNRNAVVQVEARKFSSGADIHAFLKSACGRKLNQRSKSRNKLNSPSHKRHPQGYTPDGTSAAVQASYPRTRGLIPK